MTGFIIAIKKDKSWVMANWNTRDIAQLLDPFICQHKASLVWHNYCKEVLRLIYKYWDYVIATFYHACHKSKKTLCQLSQIARNSFSYTNACFLVNTRIVKKSYPINTHCRLYSKFGYITDINWKLSIFPRLSLLVLLWLTFIMPTLRTFWKNLFPWTYAIIWVLAITVYIDNFFKAYFRCSFFSFQLLFLPRSQWIILDLALRGILRLFMPEIEQMLSQILRKMSETID